MALCAKEKLGFKDGRLVEPETLNPLFDIWKRIDCMVSTWILNSISPGMKDQFMFTFTWDELNELEPPIVCICIEGCLVTQEFLKKEQRNKLMQFLMGLNESMI
ncbi:hypothetical protein Leryth_027177 [Lithospermum erythrorhizon]|nr:hypothetical protein Leryth_027177 [Lithospermum erythrorhizon]